VNGVKFCSFSTFCNPFLTPFLVKSGFSRATFPALC
jgi:hypothetical protein